MDSSLLIPVYLQKQFSEGRMMQVRGAPSPSAQRCCGPLHKSPDLQTDDSTLCGCVSVWVVLIGTRIMETVTWGREIVWVASFVQMCHPLCLPQDCDNACESAHK